MQRGPTRNLERNAEAQVAYIRERLSSLPAQATIGQPISHRLDHLLSGVRAQIAVKIFGDDTDTLRGLAEQLRAQLATVPGLVDLTVEKQVLIPQISVRLDHRKAAQMGLAPGEAIRVLQALTDVAHGAQVRRAGSRVSACPRYSSPCWCRNVWRACSRTPASLISSMLCLIDSGNGRSSASR